ncbi:unnamed protein product [Pleuronectes platessa]|uniref:Uncharacterized protein n=1 Tax=Pleuronectes platessa TaxID=8262 RepID=A0A9N7Y7B5_PLEPL|nr:unnamed protein product [Pleuronectes platessa]
MNKPEKESEPPTLKQNQMDPVGQKSDTMYPVCPHHTRPNELLVDSGIAEHEVPQQRPLTPAGSEHHRVAPHRGSRLFPVCSNRPLEPLSSSFKLFSISSFYSSSFLSHLSSSSSSLLLQIWRRCPERACGGQAQISEVCVFEVKVRYRVVKGRRLEPLVSHWKFFKSLSERKYPFAS